MNAALAKASGLHAVPNHRPLISQTSTIATDPEAAVTAAADLLAALSFSRISGRPQHPKQDERGIEKKKKTSPTRSRPT